MTRKMKVWKLYHEEHNSSRNKYQLVQDSRKEQWSREKEYVLWFRQNYQHLPPSLLTAMFSYMVTQLSDSQVSRLYLEDDASGRVVMRIRKVCIKDSYTVWHITDPKKLHHSGHGLGKGTKMLKFICPGSFYHSRSWGVA